MTDPLRSGASAAPGEVPERDRDARVEELLLSGLDLYFAGQHDLAVNVWTRILFLDRGHARARAYIDRARSAIAERQREGEELVHTGAAAFHRGEPDAARRLLTTAVEQGAGTDEARALLDRLDRLEAAAVQQESRARHQTNPRIAPQMDGHTVGGDRSWLGWIAAGVVLGIGAVGLMLALGWTDRDAWLSIGPGSPPPSAARAGDDPLPVPSVASVWISRAHALYSKGHLHEALVALEAIRPGDALRDEADQLQATIQRQLLAAARTGAVGAPRPPDSPRP